MARYFTAEKIINDVAVETGLNPSTDVWASTDPAFVQLRYLLNGAGQELLELYPWEVLRRKHTITTDAGTNPTQKYDLPADFGYMIDQTGWDQDNNVPLHGGVTPQQWAYMEGRDFGSSTIYATFRFDEGKIQFYPSTLADGRVITFYYISRNWAETTLAVGIDEITANNNVIRYEPILIKRMLKMKFQAAKGFDNSNATQEFAMALDSWTGKSKGAQILSASGRGRGYPFISVWRNVRDSGYGL